MTALLFDARHETPTTRAPPPLAKQSPPRDYISFSAIRTYQQCPLRYFYRYIAGIPEETISAALVFGSGIHRAIEQHFRQLLETNTAPSLEVLLSAYWSEWQAQSLPVRFSKDEQAASFDALAKRMLTTFVASDLAKPAGRILAIEESLRGELVPGLPDLLGKVDLILETPTELLVTDWKSAPDVSVLAQR
jgi:RecB family exonuclease